MSGEGGEFLQKLLEVGLGCLKLLEDLPGTARCLDKRLVVGEGEILARENK